MRRSMLSAVLACCIGAVLAQDTSRLTRTKALTPTEVGKKENQLREDLVKAIQKLSRVESVPNSSADSLGGEPVVGGVLLGGTPKVLGAGNRSSYLVGDNATIDDINVLVRERNILHRMFGDGSNQYTLKDVSTLELFKANSKQWLAEGQAVFVLFDKTRATRNAQGTELSLLRFQAAYETCSGERFADEVAFRPEPCTAFLADLVPGSPGRFVVTAAHCLDGLPNSTRSGNAEKMVVGLNYWFSPPQTASPYTTMTLKTIPVKRLVDHRFARNGSDWAILELESDVPDVVPLKLATEEVTLDREVHALGYPKGIPLKLSAGGKVVKVDVQAGRFQATVDSFVGNSGSPIVDTKTREVVGILTNVYGDLVKVSEGSTAPMSASSCYRMAACTSVATCGANAGEEAVSITEVRMSELARRADRSSNSGRIVPRTLRAQGS